VIDHTAVIIGQRSLENATKQGLSQKKDASALNDADPRRARCAGFRSVHKDCSKKSA
jgi:hypothetical protein